MRFWNEISERLAGLTGSATPEETRQALNEFDVRDIQAVRVSEGGGGGGGSQPWTEHDLSALEADWTDDGVGTWTFVDGVISQTDDTADSVLLYTNTPYPSIEYVIEAEIRIPTGQDSGTTASAVITAGNNNQIANLGTGLSACLVGEGVILTAQGSGDGGVLKTDVWVDAGVAANGPIDTALLQDAWHTLRAVVNGTRQVVYIDGTYFGANEAISGGNDTFDVAPPGFTDLVGIGAIGLVDFRNVKVWTRPVPA